MIFIVLSSLCFLDCAICTTHLSYYAIPWLQPKHIFRLPIPLLHLQECLLTMSLTFEALMVPLITSPKSLSYVFELLLALNFWFVARTCWLGNKPFWNCALISEQICLSLCNVLFISIFIPQKDAAVVFLCNKASVTKILDETHKKCSTLLERWWFKD